LKKILTSVIIVILVLSALAALSAPHVKAQTLEAKIVSYRWYVSSTNDITEWAGDLVAIGEIQNTGTTTIGSAFVYGTAYNSSDLAVDSEEAQVLATNILPGQKAPFCIDFVPEDSPTGDQSWVPSVTNVTVSIVDVFNSTETPYLGLTVPSSSISGSDIGGLYILTAAIENTGNQIVGPVWAITTFYNSAGKVLSLNLTNCLTNSLAPGNSIEFTATPADNTAAISSKIANYSVVVQYGSLSTASATPTPQDAVTPNPASSPGASKSTPTSNSKTSLLVTYGIIAVVLVIVAAVVAVMLFRNRRNNDQFAPPPPPPLPLPPPPPP
jgi:hypothetical protein